MLGVPLLATAGVIGLAALHGALGSPLGPKFASELWDMAKSLVWSWLVYGPFLLGVQKHNARAAMEAGGGPAGGGELQAGRHSPRALSPAGKEGQDVDRVDGRTDRASRRRP
jgi:hypothetical protein